MFFIMEGVGDLGTERAGRLIFAGCCCAFSNEYDINPNRVLLFGSMLDYFD
jgi:hypothetical protein